MNAPLDRVRVVDATSDLAGGMAAALLADLGADVLRLPPAPGFGRPSDPCRDRGKRLLPARAGRGLADAIGDLACSADLLVLDRTRPELDAATLDLERLAAGHPRLLILWMPPTSTGHELATVGRSHFLLSCLTGLASLQYRYTPDAPTYLVTPILHYGQGFMGTLAAAAGLFERERSGSGQIITVSGLEGTAAFAPSSIVKARELFRMAGRDSRGGTPNYRLYRCRDGEWLFLAALSQPFFLQALEVLDALEILALPEVGGEFANLLKPPGSERVAALLDPVFATRTRDDWLARFAAAGVPSGPVGTREAWFASAHVREGNLRVDVDTGARRVHLPAPPLVFAGRLPAPRPPREAPEATWEHPAAAPVAREGPRPGGPLQGVRVLDLGSVVAAPAAGTLLAFLGAEVIKVETTAGDFFRTYGLGFIPVNRGKRSIAIDLKQPEGRACFLDLVRTADVVLDNYRPGVLDRLGIDHASLAAVQPAIVTCSITGFGAAGPLHDEPGFDPLLQARSGLMTAQGGPDEPVFHHIPVTDISAAILAAFGIATALFERARTGRGGAVQTSLAHASLAAQAEEFSRLAGDAPPLQGSRDFNGPGPFACSYATRAGRIAIDCREQAEREGLLAALGLDPRLARERDPESAGAAIAAALHDAAPGAILERLAACGIDAVVVRDGDTLFTDPFLRKQGFLDRYEDPTYGAIDGVGRYATFSRTPATHRGRAPALGDGTVPLLRELGLDDAAIAALRRDGVIAAAPP